MQMREADEAKTVDALLLGSSLGVGAARRVSLGYGFTTVARRRPVVYDERMSTDATTTKPKWRGFASMSAEQKNRIASMGGKASHASSNAHQFTPEEARAAAKKSHAPSNNRKKSQAGS